MIIVQIISFLFLVVFLWLGVSLKTLVLCLASILIISTLTLVRPTHVFSPRFWALLGVMFYLVLAPLGIPVSYSSYHESIYYESYLYVIIAVLSFLLSFCLCPAEKKVEEWVPRQESEHLVKGMKYAGVGFTLLGYAFFLYSFSRIGGIFQALTENRIDKAQALSESYGSIPYSIFLSIGLAGYLFSIVERLPSKLDWASIKSNRELAVFIALISPIIMFWLVEGERSALIKLLLILGGVLSLRYRLSFNKKTLGLFAIAFFLLTFIGYFRGPLALSLKEGSLNPIKNRIQQASFHWLFPREFSAIYFSHTTSVYLKDPLLYGSSYLTSVPNLLPRTLYPGKKPETISHEFGQRIATLVGRDRAFGVGFSPLAEAYVNFRGAGVFLVFLMFGALAATSSRVLNQQNSFLILLYCMSLPMFWLFFRSPFAGVLRYLVFCYLLLFIFFIVAHLIAYAHQGRKIPITNFSA